jgi:hypothetical protein
MYKKTRLVRVRGADGRLTLEQMEKLKSLVPEGEYIVCSETIYFFYSRPHRSPCALVNYVMKQC